MYRVLSSLALLCIVITCCIASNCFQMDIFTEVDEKFVSIESAYLDGDYDLCKTLSKDLIDYYEENTDFLMFFTKHNSIESLRLDIKKLPSLLEVHPSLFKTALDTCRGELDIMKSQDVPSLINIL